MSVQHINNKKELDNILETGKITVIDFYADWCGPCKILGPRFEKAAAATEHQYVNFIKVNVDEAEELKNQYNINSIPTLIYFKQDGSIFRSPVHGLVQIEDINNTIKEIKGK